MVATHTACVDSGRFPSFAGIYTLRATSLRSSARVFPFEAHPPAALTVSQDILQNGFEAWRNVSLVINEAETGHFLMDGSVNSEGALVSATRHVARSILEPFSYNDTSSDFLGLGQGYSCAFTLGASMEVRILNPTAGDLIRSYPECVEEVTSRGTLCVQRDRNQMAPLGDHWRQLGEPSLRVTVTVYKTQTHTPELCGKTGEFAEMTLTYEREVSGALEDIDLRMSRAEATSTGLTEELQSLRTAPSGLRSLISLPEHAEELREIWPDEP